MSTVDNSSIQGNILKGFTRDYAVYLFVRFRGEAEQVRPALGILLAKYVTSADKQDAITRAWKETGESAGVGMFGLSWTGYRRLKRQGAVDTSDDLGGRGFQRGMKQPAYFEPNLSGWESGYGSDVDGLLLLADHDPFRLKQTAAAVKASLGPIADITAEERGGRLFAGSQDSRYEVEHVGFRDGISRPRDPAAVLTPEPPAGGVPDGFGCYAVFMKLEQDVAGFRGQSEEIANYVAQKASVTVSPERVQALAIGRHQDGRPLVPYGKDLNDFTFEDIPHGSCPFQSHIRVMNSRDGEPAINIIRRGMSYGPPRLDLDDASTPPPSTGSGLLFLSFQRSLLDFMFLHQRAFRRRDPLLSPRELWSVEDGPAPISCVRGAGAGQTWLFEGKQVCFPFGNLTTLRGGEYFYIPSMRFIQRLAG